MYDLRCIKAVVYKDQDKHDGQLKKIVLRNDQAFDEDDSDDTDNNDEQKSTKVVNWMK